MFRILNTQQFCANLLKNKNLSSVSVQSLKSVPLIQPTVTVPIFESLYEISRSGYEVKIPRIVMTGNQSSGKTSLLEAMCSIHNLFEKKAGLATKRPIYIYLNKIAEGEADYCKIGKLGEKISNMEKARIRISEENNIDGISEEPFDVAIYSPNIPYSCNLIDLPGFISTVKNGQDEGLPLKIKKINEKYIIDDSNLKMIVMSATEDVALSLALREIKKHHQLQNSIGVFTKIDLVTNERIGTSQLEELLLDKSYTSFKCIGVKLRSTTDIQNGVTIPLMIKNEKDFINQYGLNKNKEIKVGLDVLMKDISDEQIKRISHQLPEIRSQLVTMIEKKTQGSTVLDKLIHSSDMSDISRELDRIITEIHPESDLRIELEKKIRNKIAEYVSSFIKELNVSHELSLKACSSDQKSYINLNKVRGCITQNKFDSDPDIFQKNLMYGLCKADVTESELRRLVIDNFNRSLITPFYTLEKTSTYSKTKFIKDVQKIIDNMISSKFSEHIIQIVLNEIKDHILQKDTDIDDVGKIFFVHIFDKICERANKDELKKSITRMIIREKRLDMNYQKLINNIHEIAKQNNDNVKLEEITGFGLVFPSEKYPLVAELYGPLMYSAYMRCLSESVANDCYRITSENLLDPIIRNAIKYSLDTVSKKDFSAEQENLKKQTEKLIKQLQTLDEIVNKK